MAGYDCWSRQSILSLGLKQTVMNRSCGGNFSENTLQSSTPYSSMQLHLACVIRSEITIRLLLLLADGMECNLTYFANTSKILEVTLTN